MLSILLLYFIGKRFYDLSIEYDKNKWLFAILGVATYYVVGWIFIFILVLLDMYVFYWNFDWESRFGMNLLFLPAGLSAVWGLYMLLENNWKKSVVIVKDEINDIGRNIDEN
jgi:hypothetical protein